MKVKAILKNSEGIRIYEGTHVNYELFRRTSDHSYYLDLDNPEIDSLVQLYDESANGGKDWITLLGIIIEIILVTPRRIVVLLMSFPLTKLELIFDES